MKKNIIIIFLFGLFIFVLYHNKNNKNEVDLGNGYYYIPFNEIVFDVTRYSGNGLYFYKMNKKFPLIFSEIENYAFSENFIVVKQNFNLETRYLLESMIFQSDEYFSYDKKLVLLDEDFIIHNNLNKDSFDREKYIDKILETDLHIKKMILNKINYYIIEKRNNKVFGPLTLLEFEHLKKKMRIQLDL